MVDNDYVGYVKFSVILMFGKNLAIAKRRTIINCVKIVIQIKNTAP